MAVRCWFRAAVVPNRPPPRRHSRQIGRVERFTSDLTGAGRSCPGRSASGRKKVPFDTDNLHETPEFGHRAKLAWIRARRGAGRRDLNPHGPFKPCGFSYRLRLSPPGRGAFGWLTSGLRSGLSLHPPPESPELRCCPSSLYTFPAAVSPGLARDCHLRFPRI